MNGRRLQLALLLSLGLNLFLVGLLVGGLLTGLRGDTDRRARHGPGHYWAAAERFDPAERDAFRALLRREAEENAPRVRALRQARREAQAAVSGPALDAAAAQAALARAHREELALRADVDAAVLQFATRLDAEERVALGEAMRRPKGRRGERRERR